MLHILSDVTGSVSPLTNTLLVQYESTCMQLIQNRQHVSAEGSVAQAHKWARNTWMIQYIRSYLHPYDDFLSSLTIAFVKKNKHQLKMDSISHVYGPIVKGSSNFCKSGG